jgi:hypothetical protein
VGWRERERERERVVAFLLFRLVLFRCYCTLSGKSDRLMNTDYKYENHVSFNQQMCGYQKWNQNSGGYQGSTCLDLTSCYSKNQRTSSDMSPPFLFFLNKNNQRSVKNLLFFAGSFTESAVSLSF